MLALRALLFGVNALIAAFTTAYSVAMPSLTRRDLLFGVTVAPGARESPAVRGIIRGYRAGVVAFCVAVLGAWAAIYALAPDAWLRTPWLPVSIIAMEMLLAVPYLFAHRATRALGAPSPEAPAAPRPGPSAELRPRHYSDYIGWIWEVLPIAIIVATVAYLASQYADAPAMIPTHFDLAGNPNRFAPKSIGSYFLPVWIQIFIEGFMTAAAVLVVGAKTIPGAADDLFRRLWLRRLYLIKVLIIGFLGILFAVTRAGTSAMHFNGTPVIVLVLAFDAILLFTTLALALRTGQGGARLGSASETATDRTSDRYWALGVIYINRDDPALVVERRFGVGWTLNFGNPRAIVVLGVLVALIVGFVAITVLVSAAK